jgi:membrane carboxypeptidase/penicillin-binding protein
VSGAGAAALPGGPPKPKKRRLLRYALWAVLGPLILLIAWESFTVLRARLRTPEALAAMRQGPLRLQDLPPHRIEMLLKVEDPGFFSHHGVDFSTPGAGMTSIPQALVKVFYFDDFEPGFAKLEQSLIARFVLDPALSKGEQLEAFLNHARLGTLEGRTVSGFADAATAYYGRPLDRLNDHEFLSLVAMLMAPNALDPRRHPAANAERVRRIEAMLAGRCAPQGLRDNSYPACAGL